MVCLVAATLLWPALAQAPDADFDCIDPRRTDPSPVSYPEDQRILFDTWNYERLLGSGGRLQTLDIDGEGSGVSSKVPLMHITGEIICIHILLHIYKALGN